MYEHTCRYIRKSTSTALQKGNVAMGHHPSAQVTNFTSPFSKLIINKEFHIIFTLTALILLSNILWRCMSGKEISELKRHLVVNTDSVAVTVSNLSHTSQDLQNDVLMRTIDISMMYSGILVICLPVCNFTCYRCCYDSCGL